MSYHDDDNVDDGHDDYVGVVDIKRKESNIYLDIRKASSSQRFEVIDRILDVNIVIVMPINNSVEICTTLLIIHSRSICLSMMIIVMTI